MKKKTLIIAILTFGVLALTGIYGLRSVSAQERNWYPSIVQKLVGRFNLNEGEVKQVFDEAREEKYAQMQVSFEERLNEAVTSGGITEEQKQLILAKHEEMKAEKEVNWELFKNMTWEQRREVHQAKHEEMKKWAEENGIDLELFRLGRGFKRGHFGPKI